jgi:hypothetical protein
VKLTDFVLDSVVNILESGHKNHTVDGKPIFLKKEHWEQLLKEMNLNESELPFDAKGDKFVSFYIEPDVSVRLIEDPDPKNIKYAIH